MLSMTDQQSSISNAEVKKIAPVTMWPKLFFFQQDQLNTGSQGISLETVRRVVVNHKPISKGM